MTIFQLKTVFVTLISVFFCLASFSQETPDNLSLKQVLIFGRHHVRAPLSTNGSVLQEVTNKEWPQWSVEGGGLTTKGGVLEAYLGAYTREWLRKNGLLTEGSCPKPKEFYAYANSLQRTVATANFFIVGAFPVCNISTFHSLKLGNMDPVFHPAINNGSQKFKLRIQEAMGETSKQLDLTKVYRELDEILDYIHSADCIKKEDCSLANKKRKNSFILEKGEEPTMEGPLRIANSVVDAFNMQYYEGIPINEVGWGKFKTESRQRRLIQVVNEYEDLLFSTGGIAKDLATPLINYIDNNFNTGKISEGNPQITLMIGHDSNIATLLSTLDFEDYELPGQYESTPIGGQLVFQRWYNVESNEDLLRIEYVYQTRAQIREATPLSLDTPPERVTLILKDIPVIKGVYHKWSDFKGRLHNP